MNCVRSKDFYLQNSGSGLPVFYKPFFLEVVTNGSWEVSSVCENGVLLAAMPYYFDKKKNGVIRQPPFAIYQGPFFIESEFGKLTLSKEMEAMAALECSLIPFEYYNQNWHPATRNWLPFHWKGYVQSTRYSYVIRDSRDGNSFRSEYNENVRRNLKKAATTLTVTQTTDVEALMFLIHKTFRRKNLSQPYDAVMLKSLVLACSSENCCSILVAKDGHGDLHAGIFLVWDDKWVYYLAGGMDEKFRNSGAMTLLFDKAIEFAINTGRSFDFEGSMIQSIESFYRSFGAKQSEYFVVTKVNSTRLRARLALGKHYPVFNPF